MSSETSGTPGENNASSEALPVVYTADELEARFFTLLDTMDFATEIKELGISRLSVFKRAEGKAQFNALCVGLWKLALERSFPNDAEAFFQHFIETSTLFNGKGHKFTRLRELALGYTELLSLKRESDFSEVADHLLHILKVPGDDLRSIRLKLALRIRGIYSLIFTNLI